MFDPITNERTIIAAAVPPGAVVKIWEEGNNIGRATRDVTVKKVHNSDPEPGTIRWELEGGLDFHAPAALRVGLVSLPS